VEHYRKLERMYAAAPVNRHFAPTLTVGDGTAEVRMEVREDFHHSAGAMHGCIYFKCLDDAAFFAANSRVTEYFVLTAHFALDLLRPVSSGELRAVGTVTEEDERAIHATATLYDEEDNVVGRGQGRFARSRMPLSPEVDYA